MKNNTMKILLCFLLIVSVSGFAQAIGNDQYVKAELISPDLTIEPGHDFWLGVHFQIEDHWHIYWQNPGDAGMPPKIEWELPGGITERQTLWPLPEIISVAHLANYGYENELILPVLFHADESLTIKKTIMLSASVNWLVCKESCIPGSAESTIELVISKTNPEKNPLWHEKFEYFYSRVPGADADWESTAVFGDSLIEITLTPPSKTNVEKIKNLTFLPYSPDLIQHSSHQDWTVVGSQIKILLKKSPYLLSVPDEIGGVLSIESEQKKGTVRHGVILNIKNIRRN